MENEAGHDRAATTFPNPSDSVLPATLSPAGNLIPPPELNGGGSLVAVVKKKRGRPPKSAASSSSAAAPKRMKKEKEEEDVCFICFDGGNLVLCDRRDCPKAYHPVCVKRDESFFKRRLRWNCGWHLCNFCQRNAIFMCYTCPYSLCKACVKQSDISCVRGNKGFCKACMATISLIENIKQGNEEVAHVDFDDTTSWEYLFKVYWVYLKEKESLTLNELTRATNPWKGLTLNHVHNPSQEIQNTCVNRTVELSSTVDPLEIHNNQVETNASKRRKTRKHPPLQNNFREGIIADKLLEGVAEWASQELLEFVAHVKNGDTSQLTHFDVQALLLEYIRKNKLRDPRRKCQIICDKRLEILFGKARVGHFEMLKLLEYHFKDSSCASGVVHAAAIDSSASQMKVEEYSEEVHNIVRERKRQTRKKVAERDTHMNLDNFAAIDVHNMGLIYLKRSLMENLMEDAASFHDKVVGSIVRIRISGNDLKQEMYRLVRVVGTGKAVEPYKVGEKTAHIILKILNLDKTEDVRIDAISNQEFSEDECRRLRQSIKCGLVERMTVGEVHEKAVALQEVGIKDVLETEILKLNHLRDRASEMGHRKELRECVEKLELLKSAEEQQRRMHKIPEVHADPRMDPIYQSDEESEQSDTKQDGSTTPVHSTSNSKSAELISPRRGDMSYRTRAKLLRSSSSNLEHKRNASVRPELSREEDVARPLESSQSSLELETDAARILEELRNQVDPCRISSKHEAMASESHPRDAFDSSVTSSSRLALSPYTELEKIWHYRDPAGKVQGPFCMMQLRKWNSSNYFPVDLRVWRIDESQDKSVLLADVLSSQCGKERQMKSDCLETPEARSLSDCRNLECGGQPSIDVTAAWTSDKPNGACNSDLTDAARCPDDKEQLITGNSGQEAVMDSVSRLKPEENQESPHVASSPGQKVSNTSASKVSNASPASKDPVLATINLNHVSECSDLPSPTPKDDNEDSNYLAVEHGQQFSAPNVSFHKSTSSPRMSSGGLEPDLPGLTKIKPEIDLANFKEQAEENKVEVQAEAHNQQVTSVILEQNSGSGWKTSCGQINYFDLPSQTPELNNGETKSQVTEAKDSVASYLPVQDPSTTWNVLSSGIGFSVPVSSTNPSNIGIDLNTEHCLTSNATCQEIGITWSTVTCQFNNSSSAHPDCITSSWPDGPIELSTLGDESVSDLLTEVEALESLHGLPLPSPNSRMDFGDDSIDSPSHDCFSRLVGLGPPLETGKHDAWSTTCDMQFHSQPTVTGPHPAYLVDLHGCATNPAGEDRRMKLDFASSEQACLSLTSTSLLSPAVNLQSPGGLKPEDVKPVSLPMHSLGFDSHVHPLTSLSLSSTVSCRGAEMEGEGKLDSVPNSSNQDFVYQDHNNPEPPPPPPARSPHSSANPEDRGDGNLVHVSENTIELAARSPSSSANPEDKGDGNIVHVSENTIELAARSPHSSANPEDKGDGNLVHVSENTIGTSEVNLPPVPLSASASSSVFSTANRLEVALNSTQESISDVGLAPVQQPLSAPTTVRLDILSPGKSGMNLAYVPASQEQPVCHIDVPPSPLQLPSSTADAPSSPVEEGELEVTDLSLELPVQVPTADSPKRHPAADSPKGSVLTRTSLEPTSPGEEGELKPSADLSIQQHEPTSHPKMSLPSSTPTPNTSSTRKGPVKENAGSSAIGSVAGSTKPNSGPSQPSPGTAPSGHGSVHRNPAQGNRGSQQPRYQGGRGRQSGQKDRSFHHGVDPGFLKTSRPTWHRQSSFNGIGGVVGVGGVIVGASRPLLPLPQHRGQRVCKFYESGYCRKGASCSYLHP